MAYRSQMGELQPDTGIITEAAELAHYNEVAGRGDRYSHLKSCVERVRDLGTSWAVPVTSWLDTAPDCAAQADTYVHLSRSIVGGRVLSLGGTGQAALKALVGGASESALVTPSPGEAELAQRVAADLGLSSRFSTFIGYAESLPLDTASFTAVISEGCLHHTNTEQAFKECSRVLVAGGRFAAWEPWKARLYSLGISIFGKRDPAINCRPMEAARLTGLQAAFPTAAEVRLHGAVTRYPAIVWGRLVRPPKVSTSYRVTLLDDSISRRIPALARNGSSCAILAVK